MASLSACSVASLEIGESLAGTAIESVDRWLMLEVTDPWAPKALETAVLPKSVRARLHDWLHAGRSRFQLIRRPGRAGKKPWVMRVSSVEGGKQVSRLELDRYEDLLDVDLDTLPGQEAGPICLICVHGRRDRCCALHGSAVFRVVQSLGVEAWQTSHLGGHRFAACALWLPDGLLYGRLRPEQARAFVSAHHAGEIGELDSFRGRCAYDRPTQAAEIFLFRRLGEKVAGAFHWLGTSPGPGSTWHVRFRRGSTEEGVRVRLEHTGKTRPASCGGQPEPVTRFVEL